jgi:O-antigen/teichoic acid export membrane protein
MDNIKKKIIDLSSIGITDALSVSVAGMFWFFIASEIGPENYGEITFLISIAILVSGIALFGSNNTVLVLSAKKIDIHATIYLITIVANIIGSIIIFALFFNLGISLVIIAYSMFALVTFDLLGRKWYKSYSKYIIIQKILLVGFGISLYYLIGENGILIGIALSHAHFIFHIIKSIKNSKINFNLIKERKEFFLNNFIISMTGTLTNSVDKLIIAPLLGFIILGNYSLGLQFFSLLSILPIIAMKYLTAQDISKIPNKKLKKIIVLVSIGLAILGSTIGPMVISNIFPKFTEAEDIIRILSWAIIPSTIYSTYYLPKFWALEKNRLILFTTITIIVTQLIGIVTLGSLYGVIGIAVSFVISNLCGVIFAVIIDKKVLCGTENKK